MIVLSTFITSNPNSICTSSWTWSRSTTTTSVYNSWSILQNRTLVWNCWVVLRPEEVHMSGWKLVCFQTNVPFWRILQLLYWKSTEYEIYTTTSVVLSDIIWKPSFSRPTPTSFIITTSVISSISISIVLSSITLIWSQIPSKMSSPKTFI